MFAAGIAFASNRPHYDLWRSGWLLAACALGVVSITLFVLSIDGVRSQRPFRRMWPVPSGLDSTVGFEYSHFCVAIKNDGATLRDAGMHVLVPKRCHVVRRIALDGRRTNDRGISLDSEEKLAGEDEGSIDWHDKGLHLLGGGHVTRSHFIMGGGLAPGEQHPVRVKVYDDMVRPRTLTQDHWFAIPYREVEPEKQRLQTERLRRELDQSRSELTRALGRGYYWQPNTSVVHADAGVARLCARDIDPKDAAPEFQEAIERAYREVGRVAQLAALEQFNEDAGPRRVRSEDHPERALAAVLVAKVKLDLISREGPSV